MEQLICQSCGIPLTEENRGTDANGNHCETYCSFCFQKGKFTQNFTMTQMIEFCLQYLDQINSLTGRNLTPTQAKERTLRLFPHLKRWEQKDERNMQEKAINLLAQCKNVTLVSIDANGYPRPVQMSKIGTKGFQEVWMTTSAVSMKTRDFKENNKAGLCYDHYGDSVALRGTVEVITDNSIRNEMWQDEFIYYFPNGPVDPDYVLLRFIGSEATFWINGELAHLKL